MDYPQELLPLKLECTLYFEENPFAYETVDGLAMRLGRNSSDLAITLKHLVSLKILEVMGEGSAAIYHYSKPNLTNKVDLSWDRV